MSEQFKALDLKDSKVSKIQIEVKDIAQQTTSKNTKSQLGADGGDKGGDLSHE